MSAIEDSTHESCTRQSYLPTPFVTPVAVPLISPRLIAPAVSFPVCARFPTAPPAVPVTFFAAPEAVPVAPFAAPPTVLETGADLPPVTLSRPPARLTNQHLDPYPHPRAWHAVSAAAQVLTSQGGRYCRTCLLGAEKSRREGTAEPAAVDVPVAVATPLFTASAPVSAALFTVPVAWPVVFWAAPRGFWAAPFTAPNPVVSPNLSPTQGSEHVPAGFCAAPAAGFAAPPAACPTGFLAGVGAPPAVGLAFGAAVPAGFVLGFTAAGTGFLDPMADLALGASPAGAPLVDGAFAAAGAAGFLAGGALAAGFGAAAAGLDAAAAGLGAAAAGLGAAAAGAAAFLTGALAGVLVAAFAGVLAAGFEGAFAAGAFAAGALAAGAFLTGAFAAGAFLGVSSLSTMLIFCIPSEVLVSLGLRGEARRQCEE